MLDLSYLTTRLLDMLFLGVALLGGLTIHECAHAWAADRLGDPTAKYLGRISLNPIRHLDLIGGMMILMMIVLGVGFGWAKPVPVNPRNLRHPSRDLALLAFAGPLSNVAAGLVCALILRAFILFLPPWLLADRSPIQDLTYLFLFFLFLVAVVNFGLALFNLIPIPPLDGFSVLLGILDNVPYRYRWARQLAYTLRQYEPYGPLLLIFVIIMGTLGGAGFLNALFGLAQRAASIISGYF